MTRTMKVALRLLGALCALSLSPVARAQTVTITLNPNSARAAAVPTDFAGLSIEMNAIRFDFEVRNASWLTGTNSAYIAMLRRIGIRNLRVGGNTSERDVPESPYPTDVDAARTNDFANAIQAKLLWGFPVAVKYNPLSSPRTPRACWPTSARRDTPSQRSSCWATSPTSLASA